MKPLLFIKYTILILLLASLLSACGAFTQSTPQPIPTVVLGESNSASPDITESSTEAARNNAGFTASGVIAPPREAQIGSTAGGNIETVNVAVGDTVKAGQVLVNMAGKEKLSAAVEAANVQLLTAQQALQALNDNASLAYANAQQAVAAAEKAVQAASDRVANLDHGATQEDIDAAHAAMILAKDKLDKAQEDFDPFARKSADNVVRAMMESQLASAQKQYDIAVIRYNNLLGKGNALDINLAQADLNQAKEQLADAQRQAGQLKNGPDANALALAEAQVKNAQAQLAASQAALADLELKAPFDGTVSKLNFESGEWVMPGQPILTLADRGHLQVQTTDLSERDIPDVKEGQPVTVVIKALNQSVPGHVTAISPLSDTLGGDVVYQTTIDLDEQPQGLRAGMSVDVQF